MITASTAGCSADLLIPNPSHAFLTNRTYHRQPVRFTIHGPARRLHGGTTQCSRLLSKPRVPCAVATTSLVADVTLHTETVTDCTFDVYPQTETAVASAASATASDVQEVQTTASQPTLVAHIKAHSAAVTALLVLSDQPGDIQFLSASLDKSLVHWSLQQLEDGGWRLRSSQLSLAEGPIFSLAQPSRSDQAAGGNLVFCGAASKEVLAWQPRSQTMLEQIRLGGHTGWVRALATSGKWLFSCGCNYLRQWDTSQPTPKKSGKIKLFTGDILGITAGAGKVFTCGADGSVRSWSLDAATGRLSESSFVDHAHQGRVADILWHNHGVYTAGFDGKLQGWSPDSLQIHSSVADAHGGQKVMCLAAGPDGLLYSGGCDKNVRCWNPLFLEEVCDPLPTSGAVRVLAAGKKHTLLSGDGDGNLTIWKLHTSDSPRLLMNGACKA